MHIDVADPEWVDNGSLTADASWETSSCIRITYLEYKNCPDNQRRRKLRYQCAYIFIYIFKFRFPIEA